jgi:hypothetical protein
VYYTLEITNGTCNRGGTGEKVCFFINGASPGPTLYATWGDMVIVTVNNKLQHNEGESEFFNVEKKIYLTSR